MSAGAWFMVLVAAVTLGSLAFLVFSMVRSIQNEHTPGLSRWKEFGLGLSLMVLFFGTWVAHGISEWQTYTDQQKEHQQPIEVGDFVTEFGQATLENWQSEFLQLFTFVVLTTFLIHKGSHESKDSDERMQQSLDRIEKRLQKLEVRQVRSEEQALVGAGRER